MRAFDPKGILNPGNLVPLPSSATGVHRAPRRRPRESGASVSFEIDRTSLLVRVPGTATLASIEAVLAKEELTLACARASSMEMTVADWLASGAPGAKSVFADPADHLVAGLTATLTNGRRIEVHPAPRRAVGSGSGDAMGRRERPLRND